MMNFCSLFSGSSGNAIYIEYGGRGVLVDDGVSFRALRQALASIGRDAGAIEAVFVTHEHSDHIRGLRVLMKNLDVPVFANAGTIKGILDYCPEIPGERLIRLDTGSGAEIGGIFVESFRTSHDSNESVGYVAASPEGEKVSVATDLGCLSDGVVAAMSGCGLVMLESNHDVGMLRNGSYPYYLKRRILSDTGHLSNDECSSVLPALAECGTKNFVLAHLSLENNLPQLAVEAAKCSLAQAGDLNAGCTVEAAPRSGPGRLYRVAPCGDMACSM